MVGDVYTYVKNCPDCDQKTIVIDVRERADGVVVRKRKCPGCGMTFKTVEIEDFMSDTNELLEKIRVLEKRIDDIKRMVQNA